MGWLWGYEARSLARGEEVLPTFIVESLHERFRGRFFGVHPSLTQGGVDRERCRFGGARGGSAWSVAFSSAATGHSISRDGLASSTGPALPPP